MSDVSQGDIYSIPTPVPSRGPTEVELPDPATAPVSDSMRDAQLILAELLGTYDLSELIPFAMDLIVQGFTDPDIVLIKLQEQPRYKTRFVANEQRVASGLQPLSPGEYITYERQVRQLFRRANLPEGFYDSNEDITRFIAGDKSLAELNDQVIEGYSRVATAPPEVREAFKGFFGPDGDAALAAFFLDDQAAMPVLERKIAAAEVAGYARTGGFDFTSTQATRLAEFTKSTAETRQKVGQLGDLYALTNETISERDDITGFEAAESVFADDFAQRERLRRRREARVAQFSGGGGPVVTQGGIVGLGEAE